VGAVKSGHGVGAVLHEATTVFPGTLILGITAPLHQILEGALTPTAVQELLHVEVAVPVASEQRRRKS